MLLVPSHTHTLLRSIYSCHVNMIAQPEREYIECVGVLRNIDAGA
jgi:hypothetical protein